MEVIAKKKAVGARFPERWAARKASEALVSWPGTEQ